MIGRCRQCLSHNLTTIIDLGAQRLPDFRDDDFPSPSFPLHLLQCEYCHLVQLSHTAPRDEIYHKRYGFRSGVNEQIKADLNSIVDYALKYSPGAKTWLDIACNDGTLLSMVPDGITRYGIDPVARFVTDGVHPADYLVQDYFKPEYYEPRGMDIITSVSMFYDLDDPHTFINGVRQILKPDGIWIIQQNDLSRMVQNKAIDNVCHEHVTYYSLTALRRLLTSHGLQIIDAQYSDINGGCSRVVIARTGIRRADPSVHKAMYTEQEFGVISPKVLTKAFTRMFEELMKLRELLDRMIAMGKVIYLLGASTRGGTILQTIDVGPEMIPYAIERQSAKVGRWMSATGIPIISETRGRHERPDAMLVSPWFLRDSIVAREAEYLRSGGQLIFPLPKLDIVTSM